MKKTYNALAILIASSAISFGATVIVSNVNDLDATNGFAYLNGDIVPDGTGSIQVGYFNGVADVSAATMATLVSAFTPYGNSFNFGAFTFDGLVDGTITGIVIDGSQFANQAIYVVLTNADNGFTAAGVTAATEIFIWNPSLSFPATEPFNPSINLQTGQGTIVQGGFGNYSFDFGEGSVSAFNLVAIPEPSVALLGAFGILALLRRRR